MNIQATHYAEVIWTSYRPACVCSACAFLLIYFTHFNSKMRPRKKILKMKYFFSEKPYKRYVIKVNKAYSPPGNVCYIYSYVRWLIECYATLLSIKEHQICSFWCWCGRVVYVAICILLRSSTITYMVGMWDIS